ncbi:MAG: hypothetical protein ABIM89_09355 [Mycobacteriales bacterium]
MEDRELDALYRLTPEDFVTARDSLTRSLRAAGDRELSAQVKGLRRPSVAAWLVNQLAREYGDAIDELLDTGSALRETQTAVLAGKADGAQLQALTAARRQQIDALLSSVREIAAKAGRKAAPLDAVDSTLIAATSDAAAADAVRSGRLVKELSYSGFGMGDELTDAVGPVLRAVSRAPKAAKPPKGTRAAATASATRAAPLPEAAKDADTRKRDAALAAATQSVQAAQSDVHDALGAADDAQRGLDAVSREVERAEAEEQRLTGELSAVRDSLAAAKERQRTARGAARSAHADAERVRTQLVKAQQRLDHLR